jgi:xanthine dehydrogenase YagR molybdenum-binding subunit
MSPPAVGRGIDRVDARLKVTGKAVYAAEVPVDGVAHAVFVPSTVAKGRVRSIDAAVARQVPGVLTVLTHENAPRLPHLDAKAGPVDKKLQVLQDDRVLYAGQPIALVVAESLEQAQLAASMVSVHYDADSPVEDFTTRVSYAFKPGSSGPAGDPDSKRGDPDGAIAGAPKKIDVTYTTPAENHNPMEPHATIAFWQGDDALTLYDASQGIFGVRTRLAKIFDLSPEKVRVINHYVGGGFGCKGSAWSHVPLAALAAKVTGRAVKLVLTRQQMFAVVGHRPRTVQRIQLAAGTDGKLVGIRHDVTSETSSFDEFVEPSAVQTRMLYACPNVATSHRLVRVDVGTPTFQRAPGESTGTLALESAIDELSYALAIDPIELRLRNYAETDPDEGKPWSSKSLRACYRQGAERFGWAKRTPEPRSMHDGRWLVGWGMATATYPARQSASSAIARARADGTVLVQAGSQDLGTGTYTIMTQIAADALGLPLEQVRFELGDTAMPETPVSGGSQTASSTGSAVKLACLELRKKIAGALSVPEDAASLDYAQAVKRGGGAEITAQYKADPKGNRKERSCHSFGAQFAEVRCDRDLGTVRVSRFVGAFGAGKILNAKTARSQLIGGIVWAIGMALEEHTVRDPRTARVVTRDLADYHVPVNADVPAIDVITVDEDDPYVNEIGAKGIGEIGITGAGAAIANAVFHATGKRVRDFPITLDKLL